MKRVYAFDSLKVLAIMAIFVIHYPIFYAYGGEVENSIHLSLNILARFAVPFFFAVAGYLYYFQSINNCRSYTTRYLTKLSRMYISWTMIYLLITGMVYQSWYPVTFSAPFFYATFYHGNLGSEIMWFMPALIIAVLLQFVAKKFNLSSALFAIACALHLIGLSGQSYQPLVPFEIFNPETNTFFINSRDPLFFGLFYVTLGYQLARVNAVSLIKRFPWPVYLVGVILFSGLSIAEGIWLVKGYGGIVADYYLMTIPVTLSFMALALTLPTVTKPSIFAKTGEHSGEIYLNHGVLNIAVMSVFWHMGVYSDPKISALVDNNFALQALLVPLAFAINLTLYFSIRGIFLGCFGKQTLSNFRESAIVTGAFWLLFIYTKNDQGENLFNSQNPMTLIAATSVCCMVYYTFLRFLSSSREQQSIPILKHIIVGTAVSGYWIALSASGILDFLTGIYQIEANPYIAVLSSPLMTFSLIFIVSTGITLGLQRWVYTPSVEAKKQASHYY
ncbi:acyltransferase family protein [Photobacterium chitinilyticum]|uniref:Acyltransferase n=1 Tax=Photobacterium chitinilyticum TaxID=2485123 RepID=A0A444JVN1_9GAMM|nr:acyltransferase [Photobacterium chitinilyticum]RWX57088.1 acyltransferase [Photobacterium chitinilyticum]